MERKPEKCVPLAFSTFSLRPQKSQKNGAESKKKKKKVNKLPLDPVWRPKETEISLCVFLSAFSLSPPLSSPPKQKKKSSENHASPRTLHHRKPSPDQIAAFATATAAPHLNTSPKEM